MYFVEKIGGCIATGWQFPPQPEQLHSMADRDREDLEQSTASQSPARTCHSTDRGPKGNRIVYSVSFDWKLYSQMNFYFHKIYVAWKTGTFLWFTW